MPIPERGAATFAHRRRTMVRLQERTQGQDPRRVPVAYSMSSCFPAGARLRSETSPTPTFSHGSTSSPPTPEHASGRRPKHRLTTTTRAYRRHGWCRRTRWWIRCSATQCERGTSASTPPMTLQLPRKTTPEKTTLTHDQVRQLADAAGELRTMVYVLGLRRLRYGELRRPAGAATWTCSRRRLTVSRSVTAVAGMGMVEGGTKTHQTRSVPAA